MNKIDSMSGMPVGDYDPGSIVSIDEGRFYRVAYVDNSGNQKVDMAVRFPNDQVYVIENSREKLPLKGVANWFRDAFFQAIAKSKKKATVPTSEELLEEQNAG